MALSVQASKVDEEAALLLRRLGAWLLVREQRDDEAVESDGTPAAPEGWRGQLRIALAHALAGDRSTKGRDAHVAASDVRALGRDAADADLAWGEVDRLCERARHRAGEQLYVLAQQRRLPVCIVECAERSLDEACDGLKEGVRDGYRARTDVLLERRRRTRAALAVMMVAGAESAELSAAAREAGWVAPDELLVLGAHAPDEPRPSEPSESLMRREPPYLLLIGDARCRARLLGEMRASGGEGSLAVSPAVPLVRVPEAARLVRRLLGLAAVGIVEPRPVLDCGDHEVPLWLYGEPILRQRLASRLLGPLAMETPHRRKMLGQTLLVWLERRPSAAVMAGELAVHPQTVRYRLRQLREMFGDVLDEPGEAFALLMALKATLPLWVASLPEGPEP